MNSGTIAQTTSDSLTCDSLHDSGDNLWSVLLMTGCLAKTNPNEQGETVALRIPNQEAERFVDQTLQEQRITPQNRPEVGKQKRQVLERCHSQSRKRDEMDLSPKPPP